MAEVSSPVRLRFGVFEVDLRAGELRKYGTRLKLQEQPFQVLAMLLERPGETITRDELRHRLWSAETFVDFDHAVNKAINRIRSVLGDSATSPRFVETVARRGYRFVASVEVVANTAMPSPPVVSDRIPAASAWNRRVAGAVGLAVMAVALGTWIFSAAPPAPAGIRSLAVLPLENLSGDASEEYFADGMTEELIATLGQISALRVISRTSAMPYKRARKALPQIARELHVDAVVEGTVFRSGSQVRITAQLIDARADKHLWSGSYDGDARDTLALQNTVARAVAEQIQISLNARERATLQQGRIVDPQAHEAYLKGRYFWNKRTASDLQKAVDHFNQAIARDPGYALAYSGLADTYSLLGDWEYGVLPPKEALPRAKAAALKALQLDPNLSEAYTSLAFLSDAFDWDLPSAETEFRRGIELNPGYATAHHWYAWHLSLSGRNREAIAELRKAQELDPLSLIINADLAELLLIAHSIEGSIEQSRSTIDLDPSFPLAHNQLALAYLARGRSREAIAELQTAVRLSHESATCTANLARAYAQSGRRHDALALLDQLKQRARPGFSGASEIAVVYAALGDNDQAMAWLETAYQEHFNPSVLLRPAFDGLRSDRRFDDLRRRIGLAP